MDAVAIAPYLRHRMQSLSVDVVEGASALDVDAWDRLVGDGDSSPFVEWRFLRSLEEAGTVRPETGWVPRFPVVRRDGKLVAAAPAYVKFHSQGEFVFDFSWADLCHRLGIDYYPKLLVGVPFTPVTGPRLLVAPDEDGPTLRKALAEVLIEVCQAMELSSVHVNFTTEAEIEALEAAGFHQRFGIQYHWFRRGEVSFEDYLGRFNSKRRNQLKRERRELDKQGIHIETLAGEQLKGQAETAYRLYKSTIDKLFWGRKYLTRRAFEVWCEEFTDRLRLVVARNEDDQVVAGAVNFEKGKRLYGRYWGCFEEQRHLHFNVCYYHGVDECLRKGLDVFEPGAGGEHKLVRGFEPTVMRSAHYLREPRVHGLIGDYLRREREALLREREAMLG